MKIRSRNASVLDEEGEDFAFESFDFRRDWDKLLEGIKPGQPFQLELRVIRRFPKGIPVTPFEGVPPRKYPKGF